MQLFFLKLKENEKFLIGFFPKYEKFLIVFLKKINYWIIFCENGDKYKKYCYFYKFMI